MRKLFFICLLTCLTCTNAYSKGKNSPWYVGLIGGFMDAGTGVTDSAINAGFDLGYQNNKYLSTEVEYTTSIIDGETNGGNDWNVDTLSIFAALRTNTRDIKLKGKIGITNIDAGGKDDTELSLGFGIGFWAFGGLTEIEYTELSSDNDLDFLSIGVKYFF